MEQALGDGYSLTLRKVQKNNGLILDGLCIAKGNGTIAPSIYLNSCYEQYLNGTSMEEITQKLLTAYYESSWPPILNKLVLSDYDSLRSHIAFRLINCFFQSIPFKNNASYSLDGSCHCLLSVHTGK